MTRSELKPMLKIRRPKQSYSLLCYEKMAILAALAAGPMDRAAIAFSIIGDTIGGLVLSKSSFYRHIKDLEGGGYIEVNGPLRLTDKGWRTLHQELKRIEQQRLILKTRLHV